MNVIEKLFGTHSERELKDVYKRQLNKRPKNEGKKEVRLKGSTPCATVLQEIIRGYIIDLSEPLKTLCFRGFFAISDMTKIPPGVR